MDELIESHLAALEDHLRGMIDVQERMLAVFADKREAIRTADGDKLMAVVRREQTLAEELVALDGLRIEAASQLAEQLLARRGQSATIAELAEYIDEPSRSRLLKLGEELREVVQRAAGEASVLRDAMERLTGHLRGLRSLMHGALDRARTYSRSGAMHITPRLTSALDITL
ncbi:MAG: flagellar protein FlgN [Phycisphaerales bacterium]|nr:flagellar protein FlgN [Phycisphaerales bacterium]